VTSRAILPPGALPRFLSRPQAAAYVGVSPGTFDGEVARGLWPAPLRRGRRCTWDRQLLDLAADRASGILPATRSQPEGQPDIAALEAIAMERSANAPTEKHRRQAGHPEAP
jgi:hypothetical protein